MTNAAPHNVRFTLSALFDNWCISCRHWADFFLTLLAGEKTEITEELLLDAVRNFGKSCFCDQVLADIMYPLPFYLSPELL